MKLDIDRLIDTLGGLSDDDLNTILDTRDSEPFDSAWCELNEIVGGNEQRPDAEELFVRISEVVHQHEITSYIADDLDLIHRATTKGIDTAFLRYLIASYAEGLVPDRCP